jgi:glutaredoxin 3
MDMIKIYATETCPWCKRARSLAEQYQLKYEYIIIYSDELKREFRELFPEATTVPQITWNGNYIGGYEDFKAEIENTREFGQGEF